MTVNVKIHLAWSLSDFAADESDENGKGSEPYSVFKFAWGRVLAETEIHALELHPRCVVYRCERGRINRISLFVYHTAVGNASVVEMSGQRYLRSVNLDDNDHRDHLLLRIEGAVPDLWNGAGSGRIQIRVAEHIVYSSLRRSVENFFVSDGEASLAHDGICIIILAVRSGIAYREMI